MGEEFLLKLPSRDCHWTSLMINQHPSEPRSRSMSPYGITGPQCMVTLAPGKVVKIKFFHGPTLAILLFYQYENEFREIYIHANATQLDIWCYI